MTISTRAIAAATAIAFIGVLAGLAIGQIATADSTGARATASSSHQAQAGMLRELRQQTRLLRTQSRTISSLDQRLANIESRIGFSASTNLSAMLGGISEDTANIRANTYGTCNRQGAGIICRR